MKTVTVSVNCPDPLHLLKSFKDRVKTAISDPNIISYGNVHIFFTGYYDMIINSDLLIVTAFDIARAGRQEIRIVTGGGGEGLPGISKGSEDRGNDIITKILKDICGPNNWDIKIVKTGWEPDDSRLFNNSSPAVKRMDPEKLERYADEYEEMSIRHNELLDSGMEQSAEKLYQDWCDSHPEESN